MTAGIPNTIRTGRANAVSRIQGRVDTHPAAGNKPNENERHAADAGREPQLNPSSAELVKSGVLGCEAMLDENAQHHEPRLDGEQVLRRWPSG